MTQSTHPDDTLLNAALAAARDTKCLRVGHGVRHGTAAVFASLYGSAPAMIVADENTFAAAGRDVHDSLRAAGQPCAPTLILRGAPLYAEYSFVDQVRDALATTDAVPVAVGAGTIGDLTKLASHQTGRPYMTVATAASMDGYTAFGASITFQGSKQTFQCPAAQAVVADLDVICAAPDGLNASGYADLVAKIPAGADWLVADALGVEMIDQPVWDTVQQRLRQWCADPDGVRLRNPESIRGLITGLMMTGFAMQAACASRPASGAEHQFSHLWDMEHHTHNGAAPSHGFKVGIGSLASVAMYEALLEMPLASLDVRAAVAAWPDASALESEIASLFTIKELAAKSREESLAKLLSRDELSQQLALLKDVWPALAPRLRSQLGRYSEFRAMLAAAGAPTDSRQIGISTERLALSCRQAYHLRRRFTVLDLARRTANFDAAVANVVALATAAS
ncbi:MAG TPA: sn-glycerol-1-phosphate dehydrogenase [Bryobacteraceae bacterium]|nr:sn-glycerol-1-phosphate dehydrogenase [Bryobacteraceae bacterium]HPT28038.1 sn-glycerol-1-phosphate dehydrogenase [Bryobacteraceae bacterium]